MADISLKITLYFSNSQWNSYFEYFNIRWTLSSFKNNIEKIVSTFLTLFLFLPYYNCNVYINEMNDPIYIDIFRTIMNEIHRINRMQYQRGWEK